MALSSPRSVIVTGGSGGIGRAAALRLARDGAQILVHYSGNRDAAREPRRSPGNGRRRRPGRRHRPRFRR